MILPVQAHLSLFTKFFKLIRAKASVVITKAMPATIVKELQPIGIG